ncbi:MAG: hypothetical protein HYX66_07140 [Ignavibacteria bacterium]|nr:hypothetical protein [Ignavibacteria bacterium]
MTRFFRASLLLLILGCATSLAQIQLEPGYKPLPLGPDMLCFRYTFHAGDSLLYHVQSEDSILFAGEPTLIKSRTEFVLVWCDSLINTNVYRIHLAVIDAREVQRTSTDTVQRTLSPWIGRRATLVIDSAGNRLEMSADDATNTAMSPGGAFQPLIFPTFGELCGRQNQSWLIRDTVALVENSVPPAAYEHATLWRVLDRADTLNRKFFQIQYTQTGIGGLSFRMDQAGINVKAQVAAFGKLTMDSSLQVPFHLFATSENKITMTTPQGTERKGKQLVSVHVSLLESRSSSPERKFSLNRR